ncbi:hypothetical protein [Stutzerimonas nitrititolerans]|uniref:hypothetical protein n=1 Tax=Stutzerimonas nitrititolerans TaxID=2482751 RepID=UPI00289FC8D0|nr:hypothetical protein [Stutzerimonas nitrititolerans]
MARYLTVSLNDMKYFLLRSAFFVIMVLFFATTETVELKACLLLVFSFYFLIKSRKNPAVFLVAFFIGYCNFSIAVGEYLIGGGLAAPFDEVRNLGVYSPLLDVLLIFNLIVALFYNGASFDVVKIRSIADVSNPFFYSVVFLALLAVFIFGVSRAPGVGYSVRITPYYEYSYILFLFCFMFSGAAREGFGFGCLREKAVAAGIIIYVVQDGYYGGRVTSVQLIYLLLLTCFARRLSVHGVIVFGISGIVFNKLVGVLRAGEVHFSVDSVIDVLGRFWGSFLVFDTPVYSYYASATHYAASLYYGFSFKVVSFFYFVVGVVMGSPNEMGNVTSYVRSHLFFNQGGGVLPSHFFFWFGWPGVVMAAALVVFLLNSFATVRSRLGLMLLVIFVVTVSRWYLYTPLALLRPLFLCICLYVFSLFGKKIFSFKWSNLS